MGKRVEIDVAQLEFDEGGNTIWIHGPNGACVLRIKTMGRITTKKCATNISAHADILVKEDIDVCVPARQRKKAAV